MRAVVLQGHRSVSVENVPDPGLLGPASAIVAVDRTAICGSDLHLYHGELGSAGIQLGHEFVGTVVETGPDVRRLRKGDRVVVSAVIGCGNCAACLGADPVLCTGTGPAVFGTTLELHGGQSEFCTVPAADAFCMPLPDNVTVEQSVLLTDILPTGFTGAMNANITPGSTVAVFGLGPVGVFALQTAKLYGPSRILAVDRLPQRLARASELGAEPIDAADGQAVAKILEATKGRGVDSAIEAVGADATIADAILSVAAGGTISVIGVNMNMEFPYPMPLAFMKRLTLKAALVSVPGTWPHLVPLIASGKLHPEQVFTHKLPLSQAAEGYRIFDNREDGVLKVLLDPSK
mgnify:CR=1 FL=1